ncbi:MAG TPA: hypothetical protein VH879_08410 [Gemmatimonadales bacterium]
MARLLWFIFMLAVGAALLAGASWAAAYTGLGDLLGAPPPEMGTQSTSFLWHGLPGVRGTPRVWRFAFSPTRIPGAPEVRVYVTPTGHVVLTEPSDLAERLKAFHNTGY